MARPPGAPDPVDGPELPDLVDPSDMTDMTDPAEGDFPFGLGAIPSPGDERDFELELDEAVALPGRFTVTGLGPVLNQGKTGTCVAHAVTGAKQWEEKRDHHGVVDFDPFWLFREAQKIDGLPRPHKGTTCRAALNVVLKQGEAVKGHPELVGRHRLAAFFKVPMTVEAMKRALIASGPLVVGTQWFEKWYQPQNGLLPLRTGASIGGHSTLVFGWDDTAASGDGCFIVRNSWGKAWGRNGNFYVRFADFLPVMHDCWRATDIVGNA